MGYPIIMHVNYCEQGQTVEQIGRKAAGWGFDGVEFRRSRRNVKETVEEYLGQIERGVKASGLKHVLFGSVAEKVVRKSPCPVLSIRHPEHEFVMP